MKALFVHDHRFILSNDGQVYSPGQFPYSIWQRYLKHFSELTVVGRSLAFSSISPINMDLSSGDKVSFVFMPNLADPLGMVRHRLKVISMLKKHIQSVDAVIIRSSLLGRLAASIALRMGKPWAIEVVGCAWDALWNYGTLKGRLYAPISWVALRRVAKNAQFALYVTQRFLQKRYPSYGVTTGVSDVNIPFSNKSILEKRLRRVQHPPKPFVFGLIGALSSKYKGIQTALAALKVVMTRLPKFEFRILGAGNTEYWKHLATKAGLINHVKFVGTLPAGEAVLKWLDDVDVYFQPSFTEGLPRSLVEAMSRGCPCIGSTAGGIPELLEAEALHRPGDIDRISNLILKSLDTQWRVDQAHINFQTSHLYSKDLLETRRDIFWSSFADHARNI